MTEIKWEEPPVDGRGRGRWNDIAAALRGNPGQWALVSDESPSSLVTSINNGRIAAFSPAGEFQARGQVISQGRSKVWARYVGEPS